jgi:Ca2+-binding EF-hand superfamily protein
MITNVNSTTFDRTSFTSGIAQKIFKKLDSNGNGGIDETELSALSGNGNTSDIGQLFSKMDSNNDGKVDQSETESVFQKLSAKMDEVFSKAAGSRPKPPSPQEMFNMADIDCSGGLDETEFSNIIQNGNGKGPQFSDFDTDGDGTITEAEHTAAMEKMGPPPGPPPGAPPEGAQNESESTNVNSDADFASTQAGTSFSDLLTALKEALDDDEDETTSSITQLFNELKNSINYSAQGKTNLSVSNTGNLLSLQA